MRREIIAAAIAATLCVALIPAVAQEPRPAAGNARFRHELLRAPDRGFIQFKQRKPRQFIIRQPVSDSDAFRRILELYPGAKVLAVRRLPGGDILVTIRIGNQLKRVRVDGKTGVIRP